MKVVLLAGGFATRISEESQDKPKPMVEIGGKPILWHIMKIYSHYGFDDFIICAGYKQCAIKEYFANYYMQNADVTYDLTDNSLVVHKSCAEPWKVTIVDTGLETMTGGRIKRIEKYIDGDDFLLTYGDGLADIDINALVDFHKSHGKLVTISAYNRSQRFGVLKVQDNGQITNFREKAKEDANLINIGFMVCNKSFIKYISDDTVVLEQEPLESAAKDGQLMAYKHEGFWQCMDTKKEKARLQELWDTGEAKWVVWEE